MAAGRLPAKSPNNAVEQTTQPTVGPPRWLSTPTRDPCISLPQVTLRQLSCNTTVKLPGFEEREPAPSKAPAPSAPAPDVLEFVHSQTPFELRDKAPLAATSFAGVRTTKSFQSVPARSNGPATPGAGAGAAAPSPVAPATGVKRKRSEAPEDAIKYVVVEPQDLKRLPRSAMTERQKEVLDAQQRKERGGAGLLSLNSQVPAAVALPPVCPYAYLLPIAIPLTSGSWAHEPSAQYRSTFDRRGRWHRGARHQQVPVSAWSGTPWALCYNSHIRCGGGHPLKSAKDACWRWQGSGCHGGSKLRPAWCTCWGPNHGDIGLRGSSLAVA